jgi:colanic acid/amylovoran biosynthesis glycosyltransferase
LSERGRIAYLTGQYPNAGTTFIQIEVEELRRLGFEVHTFAVRKPAPDQLVDASIADEHARTQYLFDGAKSRWLGALLWAVLTRPKRFVGAIRDVWTTTPAGVRARTKGIAYLLEACLLARELTRRQLRHLHNHLGEASATVAMAAARLAGVRYSLTEHGSGIFFHPVAWGFGAKIAGAAFTACISDFCRSQCMLIAPRESWPRIEVVHACVQPEFLAGRPMPVPDHARLLFVGRLTPAKGVPLLVEAVRRLEARGTHVELTLLGDGSLRSELERELAGLGERLRLLRWCPSEVVRAELARTRCLVLPSLTEGLPVVIMEALAMHRPVIATQIAGIPELLEDGAGGWLIPAGSVDALERAIREALETPVAELERLAAVGAARVRAAHDPAVEIPKLATLFDAALAGDVGPLRSRE